MPDYSEGYFELIRRVERSGTCSFDDGVKIALVHFEIWTKSKHTRAGLVKENARLYVEMWLRNLKKGDADCRKAEKAILKLYTTSLTNAHEFGIVREFCFQIVRKDIPLPQCLTEWAARNILKNDIPPKSGKGNILAIRNHCIFNAVKELLELGLVLSRNDDEKRSDSAFDAVAEAFSMS